MTQLHLSTWGEGPPALLVHQSAFKGTTCFVRQRPLSQSWRLLVPDRRGYGSSPAATSEDMDRDSRDIADLLDEFGPLHLCGVSYGGTASLIAAAMRPAMVRSLAVVEPSAFALAMDDPAVSGLVAQLTEVYSRGADMSPRDFLVAALTVLGGEPGKLPNPLTPELERHVRQVTGQKRTWLVDIPTSQLSVAAFPKLVISGGHHRGFEVVCDRLAEMIGGERAIVPGQHSVQLTGEPFNRLLDLFWRSADTR